MGPERSDEQLMLDFKAGDARAFTVLVGRHRQPLYNFVLRFVGHPQRAEDVLQETWLKVIRGSREYEPRARFTTWAFTIARNLCVDAARKERTRRTESLDVAAEGAEGEARPLMDALPGPDLNAPDRSAHNRRLQPLLVQAIGALPEEQREVFLLREYQGVGFREIADIVGVNENTVKSRMRYALESLRRQLAGHGVDGVALSAERAAIESS